MLCYSRSGSTLLRYILDTHPKIVCPPEIHLAITAARLLELCATSLFAAKLDGPDERRRAALPRVRQILAHIMDDACAAHGKPIWCEKSVSTIDYADLVFALFPQARFLCLHRNAFDFRASALEAFGVDPTGGSFGFDTYLAGNIDRGPAVVDYWCDKTRTLLDFESRHPQQCLRVHYEDLVGDPEAATAGLFDFLGVEFDAGLIDAIFSTEHARGPGDWKIRRTNEITSASVGRYDPSTLREIDAARSAVVDELHRTLGYEAIADATRA